VLVVLTRFQAAFIIKHDVHVTMMFSICFILLTSLT